MTATSRARVSRSYSRSILCALGALFALACVLTVRSASAEPLADYQIVQTNTTVVAHNYLRTVSKVQVGADPLNRFFLYRVRKPNLGCDHAGTLLLLPPVSIGFENYEVDDEGGFSRSFVAYFAKRGYDVWGISQRVQGLTAGACESGAVQCAGMGSWGLSTLVEDATFARKRISIAHPGEAPVIGGLSLGSMTTIAVLNEHPHDYAGAFLMEGTMYTEDPGVRATAQMFCDGFRQAIAGGVYYDDQSLVGLKVLANAALTAPDASASPFGFAGISNIQAFAAVMSAPPVGPLTPKPGYAFLAADPATGELTYADSEYALRNVAGNVEYMSLGIVRDIDCGLAGERTYTDKLYRYDGPLFVLAAERGFGDMMLDTADLMPDADVTLHAYAGLGHVDPYFASDHREYTERPLLRWLEHDVF